MGSVGKSISKPVATLFAGYYLASELCEDVSGGKNFFASTCAESFEIDLGRTRNISVCPAEEHAFGNCDKPLQCSNRTLNRQRLYIIQDVCHWYTIVGHAALVASFLINGAKFFMGVESLKSV